MNAAGLILMSLGLILIIIGFKGSQHKVISALTGKGAANPSAPQANKNTSSSGTSQQSQQQQLINNSNISQNAVQL